MGSKPSPGGPSIQRVAKDRPRSENPDRVWTGDSRTNDVGAGLHGFVLSRIVPNRWFVNPDVCSGVRKPMRRLLHISIYGFTLLLAGACGSTDPTPVGLNLLEQAVGETVEIPPSSAANASTHFDGLTRFILGADGELIIGRMHGVAYRSLLRARFDSASVPIQSENIAGAEIVLSLVTTGQRGEGGISLLSASTVWSEATSFVDTSGNEVAFEVAIESPHLPEVREDSVLTLTIPPAMVQDALAGNRPDIVFGLAPVEGPLEDYLIVAASREFFIDRNEDGAPDAEALAKRPFLRLTTTSGERVALPLSEDTYYGLREEAVKEGALILQTGVARSVHLRFDLPAIPADATVNFAQVSADVDLDASLSDDLTVNIRRVDVDRTGQDTTFVRVQDAFSSFVATGTSTAILFRVDHFLVQAWVSGLVENQGIALFPFFEGRYEWLEIRNPKLRLIYTLPPESDG